MAFCNRLRIFCLEKDQKLCILESFSQAKILRSTIMKFSIQRDEIYEAIQKVANVIPQRSTIAITQNILFIAEDGQLQLIATDLEITIASNVRAEIEEEGRIALPGRLIHDIVRELPNVELTFESGANNRLKLRSSFGEYKVGGENPDEFPKRPQLEAIKEIVLPNDVLKRLVEKTIFACSSDELRPALTGSRELREPS